VLLELKEVKRKESGEAMIRDCVFEEEAQNILIFIQCCYNDLRPEKQLVEYPDSANHWETKY
jgi:hypothetical protein